MNRVFDEGAFVVLCLTLSLAFHSVRAPWFAACCDAVGLWVALYQPSRRSALAADDPDVDGPSPTGGNPL